jgi:hypothetical protein
MRLFAGHLQRHHNPRLHVLVAVCATGGALLLVRGGHPVIAALAGALSVLNIAHAFAERRGTGDREHPDSEHMEELRRATREMNAREDNGSRGGECD